MVRPESEDGRDEHERGRGALIARLLKAHARLEVEHRSDDRLGVGVRLTE